MCWSTAQPESRIKLRSRSSRAIRRGRNRNPLRCSAMAGTPTKPSTPIVAPRLSTSFSASVSSRLPLLPWSTQKIAREMTSTSVLAIGAMAGIARLRFA